MKFRQKIGRVMRVYGHSMMPTLAPGALVFVGDGAFVSREPRHGEIVAAAPTALGGQSFVKRIVGLPSERVTIGERSWQLEENQFFLMGDQVEHSMDSRIFGPVSREELIGPVRLRLWPWKVFQPMSTPR
jgi:type IV secretory pathway protease TraF